MKTPRFTIYDLRFTRRSRVSPGFEQAGQPLNVPCPPPPPIAFQSRKSQIVNRKSEGIALVITLILLSVTLVMAVAFLAISRRERGSVSTTQDATTAEFAVDSAQSRAIARIVTQMEITTNPYVFSLIVSTNYINQNGFTNGSANLENVNYDHYVNSSTPLTPADFEQNIANLYYNPRPPVFYSNDFRFYLDLNRNGRFDPSGLAVTNLDNSSNGLGTVSVEVGDPEWIGILAHPDQPHGPNNPFIARYCFIAVPANSADLNYIHNQALGAGELRVNPPPSAQDEYSRDEGVGTWEMNLAAFLTDLNTNRWDPATLWNSLNEPYTYPEGSIGRSVAFDDARALVSWRYDDNYTHPFLASADDLFGGTAGWGNYAFRNNGIDYYSLGQQDTFDTNFYNYGNPSATPWLGAPLTNDYFSSPSELFNVSRSDLDFVTNLYSAGTNYSTYDRYTFYRMLAQLGTDTQPASGKINLNYQNALLNYDTNKADIGKYGTIVTNVVQTITIVPNMETNFVSWSPQNFFTAAADKLLRAYTTEWFEESPSNYMQTYYGMTEPYYTNLDGVGVTNIQFYGQTNQIPFFCITNIPVYINGSFVYTPAVNRLLQLAANIYDASTNVSTTLGSSICSNYPSVFRPVFYKAIERNYYLNQVFTNVYIRGYQYVPEPLNQQLENTILTMPLEVSDLPFSSGNGPAYSLTNVWGIPWIIGAKKGLPNFNGLEVYNTFFIERKLQFNRSSADVVSPGTLFPFGRIYTTNQMYIMGVSNCYAMDDWNSYADNFSDQVTIVGRDSFGFGLSNDAPNFLPPNNVAITVSNEVPIPLLEPYWPGSVLTTPGIPPVATYAFQFPMGSNVFLPQNLSAPVGGPASTNNEYIYHSSPTTVTFSTGSGTYNFKGPSFIATSLTPPNYMDTNNGTPPLPHLVMQTTNRLQAYMLDTQDPNNPYILDYVQLGGMNGILDVNQAIADPNGTEATANNEIGGLWSTNIDGSAPFGVVEQYFVSLGDPFPSSDSDETMGTGFGNQYGWSQIPVPGVGTATPKAQTEYFQAFFSGQNVEPVSGVTNIELSIQAPFTPARVVVQRYVYQVNDPLVHYMTQDLFDFPDSTNGHYSLKLPPAAPLYVYSGNVSDRYMPWQLGGNLAGNTIYTIPLDANSENMSYKDPMVIAPDYWDFPTNKYPTVGWLGRVHRGTPWQTVYLKSTNILSLVQPSTGGPLPSGDITWQFYTGNAFNFYDAFNTAPDQDRLLFDLFTTAPDDDAMRGQVSVNIGADDPTNMLAGLASWSALLSGTLAFSNNENSYQVTYVTPPNPPAYSVWTNQPYGITNPAMALMVQGINSTRTNLVPIDKLHGVFEHVGDILATPELSDASPFLQSLPNSANDEMYEWLPQQIMGLLTVSGTPQNPPRYVIYCYGQTLKPAPNGLVSGGQYFGMCTNYQVTAESASRAVIEVQNTPTPANPNATPHVVVVQYNPLPPD